MNIKPNELHSRDRLDNFLTSGGQRSSRAVSLLAPSLRKRKEKSKLGKYFDTNSSNRHNPNLLSRYYLKEETKNGKISSPSKVLKENPGKFSDYEKKEILEYPEIYYIGNARKKHNGIYCDERGFYKTFVGDHIAYRYEILHLVGDGSFGIVISCFDHKNQVPVAIKILRTGKEFEEIGELEVKNLDSISRKAYDDTIIEKYEEFIFRSHYCIVFELLSLDLYKYLKKNHFEGMTENVVRRIATQLIVGLKQIHHSGYIHCDLKPENILFRAENKSSIKIIDFGSACQENHTAYTYIQSRYYRAPEVLLELAYSNKIDMWSLGCILFELSVGYPLFHGDNEIEQLCKIVELFGDFPLRMCNLSKRKKELFDNNGKLVALEAKGIKGGSGSLARLLKNADVYFIDFLLGCLRLDPSERMGPEQAIVHNWIKGNKMSTSRSVRHYNKSLVFE